METEKLYYENAFLRDFTARVESCTEEKKGWCITLDRTAFYPEGGGQPSDTGTLQERNFTSPTWPLAATWVPQQAQRSTPSILTRRT